MTPKELMGLTWVVANGLGGLKRAVGLHTYSSMYPPRISLDPGCNDNLLSFAWTMFTTNQQRP